MSNKKDGAFPGSPRQSAISMSRPASQYRACIADGAYLYRHWSSYRRKLPARLERRTWRTRSSGNKVSSRFCIAQADDRSSSSEP